MKFIVVLILSLSSSLYAMTIDSETQFNQISNENLLEKWSVNYFMDFHGPKVNNLSSNETYDRYESGKNWQNEGMDATNNLYYYSSISLSYKLSRNFSIGYTTSLHHHVTSNAKYRNKGVCREVAPGKYSENGVCIDDNFERSPEHSNYNQRINAFIGNIYKNNTFYINSGLAYEFASSVNAVASKMIYAINATPSVNFWGSRGLTYGVGSDLQRYFYENDQGLQTVTIAVIPYVNYQLDDNNSLKGNLTFDWDQHGGDPGSDYHNNMDDVMTLGFSHMFNKSISSTIYTQFGIDEMSAEKSYFGANMSVNL